GLAVGQGLVDRDAGDDIFVKLGGDLHRTVPDGLAQFVRQPADVIGVELPQESRIRQEPGERSVADAIKFEVGTRGVDGNQRDAAPGARRKDEILAGEAQRRCAVADVDLERNGRLDHLADGRRQALAYDQMIAAAVLEAGDAQLLVAAVYGRRADVVDRHVLRVVDAALDQFLRELNADARSDAVGIDRMIDHAEASGALQL